MAIIYSALSDVGRVREHNEDTYLVDRKLHLYIVCDGMGGHKGGEVASATAARLVRNGLLPHAALLEAARLRGDGVVSEIDIHAILTKIIQDASRRIYEMGVSEPERRGMGTTLSLLLLVGQRGYIAHVGDSRIYRSRQDEAAQITEDHSLYNAMVRQGSKSEADAMASRLKNAVTRAVGVEEELEVDTEEIILEAGDRFLLCSDGLSGYFENGDLERLISIYDADTAVETMISFANERGGRDNVTAILIEIPGDDGNEAESDDSVVAALSATLLGAMLKPMQIQALGREFTQTTFAAGDVLFAGGSDDRALLLVLDGSVDVVDGSTIIQKLGAGEIFETLTQAEAGLPAMTLMADQESEATVARLDGGAIRRLAGDNPVLYGAFLYGVAQMVAKRLADAAVSLNEPIRAFVVPSPEELGSLEKAPLSARDTEPTQPAIAMPADGDAVPGEIPADLADDDPASLVEDTMPALHLDPDDLRRDTVPGLQAVVSPIPGTAQDSTES